MSKLKMLKFEAATLQADCKNMIEQLQQIGVVQLERIDDKRLIDVSTSEKTVSYEKNIDAVSDAMEILKNFGVDFGLGMFSGRSVLDKEQYRLNAEGVSETLNASYEIVRLNKRLSDLESERVRNTTLVDSLSVWEKLDIPLSGVSTQFSSCFVGTFPVEYSYESLNGLFAESLPQIKEYEIEIIYSSKEITSACVVCHKSVEKEVSSFLRSLSFVAPLDVTDTSAAERIKECKENLNVIDAELSDVKNTLVSYTELSEKLKFAYDYFTVKRDECQALSDVAFSDKTVYIKGYVPEKMAGKLSKVIGKNEGVVIYSEPSDEDDVPVLLSNDSFSEPCESIVEMFAIPSKNDIDPSKLMAFFYYLLFGMMLSDAGYGLVLGLGSFLILRFTSVEGSMRKMLKMFVYCGISTVFWGALFGSWFGDAIPVIRREFFGVENSGGVALWFDPISDPIKLLLFSFGIGICHLFLGVFALGYMRWRDGDKISAFCDTIPVFLTVIGAAPLAAGVIVSVPTVVTDVAKYLAIAGVILIILTSSRSGNIFVRLFGGLYALYNTASGYLSDILSYSRLLALGLATGSIGSVVNMLAVMMDGPVIKEVSFIVIFIVGHTLNMAINVLGAYVHTNRLQFVELFSKFYEGGGRAFNPLKLNTKFFRLKEENKND